MGKPRAVPRHDQISISSMSDAAVEREFARLFPAIELKRFGANRRQPVGHYVISSHFMDFTGAERDLLSLRLIQEDMLPIGKKRICSGRFTPDALGCYWRVQWIKGGRLEVHYSIGGDDCTDYPERCYVDDLPADHPLQAFHPRHWPFGDANDLRCYFESTRSETRSWIIAHMAQLDSNLTNMQAYGYGVRVEDRERMRNIVDQLGDELLQAFDEARVVSEQAPRLRLVDNEARP